MRKFSLFWSKLTYLVRVGGCIRPLLILLFNASMASPGPTTTFVGGRLKYWSIFCLSGPPYRAQLLTCELEKSRNLIRSGGASGLHFFAFLLVFWLFR